MATFFSPWIGKDYKEGIEGNTILIIGVQHWCDPSYWECPQKTPRDCLSKRDKTCFVWKGKSPNCPLHNECTDKEKDDCLIGSFRFLHCETKISIHDHIYGTEKTKRTEIFTLVFDALKKVFCNSLKKISEIEKEKSILDLLPEDLKPKEKERYWNRVVFTNYIQHYTRLLSAGRLAPTELKETPEIDKEGIKRCFNLFEKKRPDIIIVLKEKEIYTKVYHLDIVKESGYLPLEKYHDELGRFYVLTIPSSDIYRKTPQIKDFIKDYINKCPKIKSSDILELEDFLEKKKFGKNKKERRKYIVDLLPPEFCNKYYKTDESGMRIFDDSKLRTLKSKINQKGTREKGKIEELYKEFLGN